MSPRSTTPSSFTDFDGSPAPSSMELNGSIRYYGNPSSSESFRRAAVGKGSRTTGSSSEGGGILSWWKLAAVLVAAGAAGYWTYQKMNQNRRDVGAIFSPSASGDSPRVMSDAHLDDKDEGWDVVGRSPSQRQAGARTRAVFDVVENADHRDE